MSKHTNRYSGILILLVSIILAAIVSIGFYYFKIQKNEHYQNQLHFREINDFSRMLDNQKGRINRAEFAIKTEYLKFKEDLKVYESQIADYKFVRQYKESQKINKTNGKPEDSDGGETLRVIKERASQYLNNNSFSNRKQHSGVESDKEAIKRGIWENYQCIKQLIDDERECELRGERDYLEIEANKLKRILGEDLRNIKLVPIADNVVAPDSASKMILIEEGGDSHDPQTWIQKNVEIFQGAHYSFKVPLKDAFTAPLAHHPLLMLVDGEGHLLTRIENPRIDSTVSGLEFKHVQTILERLKKQRNLARQASANQSLNNDIRISTQSLSETEEKTSSAGMSGITDIEIAGVEYRVFVSPYTNANFLLSGAQHKKNDFYFIGLRSKSQLLSDKLSISRGQVAIGLGALTLLILFVPLLRLRLMSPNQGITSLTRRGVLISIVMFTTVLGAFSAVVKQHMEEEASSKARRKAIFNEISSRFENEFRTIREEAEKHWESEGLDHGFIDVICNSDIQRDTGFEDFEGFGDRLFNFDKSNAYSGRRFGEIGYALESLFVLPKDSNCPGQVSNKLFNSSPKQYRSLRNFDLSHRAYYKNARDCKLWPIPIEDGHGSGSFSESCKGLYIQRLFNIQDGKVTTQFAEAYGEENEQGQYSVFSYGSKLRTFFNAVLPPNLGYLVFDNASGIVQYHSDNSRSLVEHVYVETDNNKTLRALANSSIESQSPISFETIYQGQDHHFTAGALYQGVPWTLVVFFNKNESRNLILLKAFSSALATFLVLLCVFVVIAILGLLSAKYPQVTWMARLRPQNAEDSAKGRIKYLATLIILLIIIPILLGAFVFSRVSTPLDEALKRYDQNRVYQNVLASFRSIKEYRDKTYDYERIYLDEKSNFPICYFGKYSTESATNVREIQQTCFENLNEDLESVVEQKYSALPSSKQSISYDVVKRVIENTNLQHTINKQLLIHLTGEVDIRNAGSFESFINVFNKQSELTAIGDTNTWELLLGYLASLIVLGLVSIMVVDWIGRRMYGIYIPSHWHPEPAGEDILLNSSYLMIIRPRAGWSERLQQNDGALISNTPIHVKELLEGAYEEENIICNLFNKHGVFVPRGSLSEWSKSCDKTYLLAIEGVEDIAFERILRQRLLSVLELLMSLSNIKIVLLCDISPLYRMINQAAYPNRMVVDDYAGASESLKWANIFRKFDKHYDWVAPDKTSIAYIWDDKESAMAHEFSAWPEIVSKKSSV